ncbi:MAG: hypothetical protein IKB70_10230 [Bacilli bacterium]|nr:hypothetical protein [Bacilli bacterium]
MIDIKTLENMLSGNDLCIGLPDTEEGKLIAAFIDDYIKKHQHEFEQCLVISGNKNQCLK